MTLIVSTGRDRVVIPSLFNVPENEAADDLRELGLVVERVVAADASVAAGRVIRTEPGASTPVERGSSVTLVVSSGPPATTSPPTTQPPQTTSPPTTSAPTTSPTITITIPVTTSTTRP